MGHNGDWLAFVLAGKSPHVAHIGHAPRTVHIAIGYVLRPQRIAGHQNGLGEVPGGRVHVFGCQRFIPDLMERTGNVTADRR